VGHDQSSARRLPALVGRPAPRFSVFVTFREKHAMTLAWNMNRREFVAAGAAALGAAAGILGAPQGAAAGAVGQTGRRFRRRYAPHLGMFRFLAGDDPIDQIRFMADEGFAALEDNGLMGKPLPLQERIARELDGRGMQMGLFVGSADFGNPTFASGLPELRRRVLADVRRAVDLALRVNARCFTVVPGKLDARLPFALQTAHAVDTLRACAEICEPAGVALLLEPLNHWGSRPQLFLSGVAQAARLCRAVNSPGCRVLYDVYHQQTNGADVFSEIDRHREVIGYFQLGDSPGRKEPGTGGFDFGRFFRLADAAGYDGIYGMEHGNALPGREGERAVIAAYAELDRMA